MPDIDERGVVAPNEQLEADPSGPLLRDPPPPPGYVNPVEESEFLEEPFATREPE